MKTVLTAFAFLACCLAQQPSPATEALILTAKQQAISGDYAAAAETITNARMAIASLGSLPRDYGFTKTAGLAYASAATVHTLLDALMRALQSNAAKDTKQTVQQLDLASMTASFLLTKEAPSQRFAFSKNALEEAHAAKLSGRALDPYLHRAAKDAYAAGDYAQSLAYTSEACALTRTGSVLTPYLHWDHTIAGLDYVAQGQLDLAVTELNLSIQQIPDQAFLPSMALAAALVSKRPDAVAKYLDNLSHAEGWRNRAQAAIWKAQVQAGQTPNFGGLSNMGL